MLAVHSVWDGEPLSFPSMLLYDARMTARVENIPELTGRIQGQGPPLVLLDSPDSDAGWYRTLLPALAARYTCIVVELPAATRQWSVEQVALGLRNFIASSTWGSVNIMTFGAGSPVAEVFASHCRDRVRSLVVVNGALQSPREVASESSFEKGARELAAMLGPVIPSRGSDAMESPRGIHLIRSVLQMPGMHTLRGVACPALIIHGANNKRIPPSVAWGMKHALSMGALQFIDGGTHTSLLSGNEARDVLQFTNAFLNVHAFNEPAVGRRSLPIFSREERWVRHVLRQLTSASARTPGISLEG
ncbi:MAG: alpha/beta fold hydrolase [Candidatus Dormibacteria bacterium]